MAKKKARKRPDDSHTSKSPARDAPPLRTTTQRDKQSFPVVGLGASAGGVEAVRDFFSAMKADSGMAFAIIPHLDPEHRSAFPEILAKVTSIPVTQARDAQTVEPNHVYVLPPNAEMII